MPKKKSRIKGVLAAYFLNYYWIKNKRARDCAPVPWDLSTEHPSTTLNSTTMPPKKAAATDNTTDPPRRSGRIASQPVAEVKPKPNPKATKKRTAADDEANEGEEGSSAKKVLKFFFFFFFLLLREELKYALI
jgi:hypothetical protein